MKKSLLFFLFLVGLMGCLAGCGIVNLPDVKIYSTIPWYTSTITLVNGTSLALDVIHDGKLVWPDVQPGQYRAVRMFNYSTTTAQTTIALVAKSPNGQLIGTASRSFSVSGYYRQSEVWTVNKSDIHQ